MIADGVARALAQLKETFGHRYRRAFPNDLVPLMYWQQGTLEQLDVLMEAAIRRGKPLTADDLCKAQGMEPPAPGATWRRT
jgi:hypothetical protein